MTKLQNSGCVSNVIYKALNTNTKSGVTLCKVLKTGKVGKPCFYQFFGTESTAQEVITRMEKNNPGNTWVEA